MRPQLKQYGFWNQDSDDCAYWNLFDDLKTAVIEADGARVYELTAKSLGVFKIETVLVKEKRKRKKTKKKN